LNKGRSTTPCKEIVYESGSAGGAHPESVEAFAAANACSDPVLAAASTATTLAVLDSHSHCWRLHFDPCAHFLQLRGEISNGRFQFFNLPVLLQKFVEQDY
jgi:hypothetical protein